MSYEQQAQTLTQALERMNTTVLKKLLAQVNSSSRPTRKAELVEAVRAELDGDGLRTVWDQMDNLQKAAVMEAAVR